MDTKARI